MRVSDACFVITEELLGSFWSGHVLQGGYFYLFKPTDDI